MIEPPPFDPEGGLDVPEVPREAFRFAVVEPIGVFDVESHIEIDRLEPGDQSIGVRAVGDWLLAQIRPGLRGWVSMRAIRLLGSDLRRPWTAARLVESRQGPIPVATAWWLASGLVVVLAGLIIGVGWGDAGFGGVLAVLFAVSHLCAVVVWEGARRIPPNRLRLVVYGVLAVATVVVFWMLVYTAAYGWATREA